MIPEIEEEFSEVDEAAAGIVETLKGDAIEGEDEGGNAEVEAGGAVGTASSSRSPKEIISSFMKTGNLGGADRPAYSPLEGATPVIPAPMRPFLIDAPPSKAAPFPLIAKPLSGCVTDAAFEATDARAVEREDDCGWWDFENALDKDELVGAGEGEGEGECARDRDCGVEEEGGGESEDVVAGGRERGSGEFDLELEPIGASIASDMRVAVVLGVPGAIVPVAIVRVATLVGDEAP